MVLVPDLDWDHVTFQDPGLNHQPLLDACPNLTYVGLECGTYINQVDSIPTQVETVALLFDRHVNMKKLADALSALRTRCHNLSVIALFTNHLIEFRGEVELLETLEPVLKILSTFEEQGIHVAYFLRVLQDEESDDSVPTVSDDEAVESSSSDVKCWSEEEESSSTEEDPLSDEEDPPSQREDSSSEEEDSSDREANPSSEEDSSSADDESSSSDNDDDDSPDEGEDSSSEED